MVGELDRSGIGEPMKVDLVPSLAELQNGLAESNARLLCSMRESEHSAELLQSALKDVQAGRLTTFGPVESFPVGEILLHPRFPVVQEKADGTEKIRDVDHFSWYADVGGAASVNANTVPAEKLRHDTLDNLGDTMTVFVEKTGEVPGLIKADIKSAFRLIPVKPKHRWVCGVSFVAEGKVRVEVFKQHHL